MAAGHHTSKSPTTAAVMLTTEIQYLPPASKALREFKSSPYKKPFLSAYTTQQSSVLVFFKVQPSKEQRSHDFVALLITS